MTADEWERITSAPEMRSVMAAHGSSSPFTADVAIFSIRRHGWAWLEALGITQVVTIKGGIGTLTIGPDVVAFDPSNQAAHQAPLPATPAMTASRLSACSSCDRWQADRCTIAGCGCSGTSMASRYHSRCPLGRWPTIGQQNQQPVEPTPLL